MKTFKSKTTIALVISAAAMFVANMASSMCIVWLWDDIKMPKSLIKK